MPTVPPLAGRVTSIARDGASVDTSTMSSVPSLARPDVAALHRPRISPRIFDAGALPEMRVRSAYDTEMYVQDA